MPLIQHEVTFWVTFYTLMVNMSFFRRKIHPSVAGIFHGKLYIKIESKIEEIYADTHIYSIFTSVRAIITTKMAS